MTNVILFSLIAALLAPVRSGVIETVAGTGQPGFSGDGGPARGAKLNQPFYCDLDKQANLYIADTMNQRIRKVNLRTGIINTVAGNGKGYSGDGGPALRAMMNEPYAVVVDEDNNLFIVDRLNAVIRKVDGKTEQISTIAGGGNKNAFQLAGGKATDAKFTEPNDCCLDGKGGLLIADVATWRVWRVELKTGIISNFAGTPRTRVRLDFNRIGNGGPATRAILVGPRAVCVDGKGNTYICEREGNEIRKVDGHGTITTIAGTARRGNSGDGGDAKLATFDGPKGIRCDSAGNLYVVDTENNAIRRIDARTNVINTVAGGQSGPEGDGGEATRAGLDRPHGCVVDSRGVIYIADTLNHRVRKVGP